MDYIFTKKTDPGRRPFWVAQRSDTITIGLGRSKFAAARHLEVCRTERTKEAI